MPDSAFLDAVVPAPAPADARWVWGVVTQSSPLRIRLDGDRVALTITPDDMGAGPRPVGQRVYCQILNRRFIVMGPDSRLAPALATGADLDFYDTDGAWTVTDAIRNTVLNLPVMPSPGIGKPNVGVLRPGSAGTLYVSVVGGTRVLQRFEGFASLYQGAVSLSWERVRSSAGVWGRWRFTTVPLQVFANADYEALGKVYTSASLWNPLRVDLASARPPTQVATQDGNTWYDENTRAFVDAPTWQSFPFINGNWTNYANGFADVKSFRTADGIVILRGLCKYVPAGNPGGLVIGTLPVGHRPAGKTVFTTMDTANASGGNFAISPDGTVTWLGNTSGTGAFVSLEAMFPSAEAAPNEAWTQITTFSNSSTTGGGGVNWSDYSAVDASYPAVSYWIDSMGRVWFRGMSKASALPSVDSLVFTLPLALKPNKQIHVAGAGNVGMTAWHVVGTSTFTGVYWKIGSGVAWNSLSNLILMPEASFPEAAWTTVGLTGGWVNYAPATFPSASCMLCPDGLLIFRGLIGSGTGTPITTTNAGYRTAVTQIQATLAAYPSTNVARLDLTGLTGVIGPQPSPGANAWRSLNGMQYLVER